MRPGTRIRTGMAGAATLLAATAAVTLAAPAADASTGSRLPMRVGITAQGAAPDPLVLT
jgi:hypothetical protein